VKPLVRVEIPKKEEDLRFLEATVNEGIRDGLISEGVAELPPGITLSPQFVVHGSKDRAVDDHTASGLNDGIGKVPTVMDRIHDLIRILRYFGLLDDSLPNTAMLYKLDVSNAFKLLLMHPRWRIRQGLAVAHDM